MTVRSLAACAVVAGCLLSAAAPAAIIAYDDRATWLTAIGSVTGAENFNGFAADTSFDGLSVALASGMTIGTITPAGDVNVIDVPPLAGTHDIDGSAFAAISPWGPAPGVFPFVTFGAGVAAFGADFRDLNTDTDRVDIQLFDGVMLLTTLDLPVGTPMDLRFWGFAATAGEIITEMRFVRVGPLDIFGMDNIEIAAASTVPEPETLPLFGLGLAGLMAFGRRRGAH